MFRILSSVNLEVCWVVWVLLIGCYGENMAQATATTKLDSSAILVGDQFDFELILELNEGSILEPIDFGVLENAEGVEIIETSNLDTIKSDGSILLMQRLILTSFDSGQHTIPSIPIEYQEDGQLKYMETNGLTFSVRMIPVSAEDPELSPIKDILKESISWLDILSYFLAFVGLLALGLIGYYFINRKNVVENVRATPMVPAHQIALDKLKMLQQAKLWQQGRIKEFQSELTFIVREYLENRFKIGALESTTEETLQMVKQISEIDSAWNGRLRDMFYIADMVKFAKANPPADFHDKILVDAERFVFETKEKESTNEDEASQDI